MRKILSAINYTFLSWVQPLRWCGGIRHKGSTWRNSSHNVYFANYVHSPSPIHRIYLRFVGWEDEKFSLQYTRYFIFFAWREKVVVLLEAARRCCCCQFWDLKSFYTFYHKYRMWIYYIHIERARKKGKN